MCSKTHILVWEAGYQHRLLPRFQSMYMIYYFIYHAKFFQNSKNEYWYWWSINGYKPECIHVANSAVIFEICWRWWFSFREEWLIWIAWNKASYCHTSIWPARHIKLIWQYECTWYYFKSNCAGRQFAAAK